MNSRELIQPVRKPQPVQRKPQAQQSASPGARPSTPALSQISRLSVADAAHLQRAFGNQMVGALLRQETHTQDTSAPTIQAKLQVGPADDKYEREADQIANKVMHDKPAPNPKAAQRQEVDEDKIQTRRLSQEDEHMGAAGGPVSVGFERSLHSATGGGQPLDDRVRAHMEQGFGADFHGVRVHSDAQSDALNRSISARAFTRGADVFFRQGEYQPGSSNSQRLLAHELTHVVQQGAAPTSVQRAEDLLQRTPAIQRLTKSKTFKKNTSLFLRKGKSGATFSAITRSLRLYETRLKNAEPGAKLAHLRQLLEMVNSWLASPAAATSSRKRHAENLRDSVADEIQQIQGQLSPANNSDFDDDALVDSKDEAVGGQMNKLDYVKYGFGIEEVDGETRKAQGGEFEAYFKEDVDEDQAFGRHRGKYTGMPKLNPEFGKRNVAMYAIDKLLGANVIPPTFLAKHKGKMGIVMKKVEGVAGDKTKQNDVDMDDPIIRQSLSKLYLLDVICAQVDRHPGNYIVVMENGVIKGVKGIDNDLSFGKKYNVKEFDKMSGFNKEFAPVIGKLPSELKEIDQRFAQKIIDLSEEPKRVREALDGLLSDDEIDATIERIEHLAEFLQPLMGKQDGVMRTRWTA